MEIEGDNRKFRAIFEENLERFLPKSYRLCKILRYKDDLLEHSPFQRDGETVQIVRDITAEEGMLNTLFLILVIGCSIGSLCAIGIGFFLAGRALVPIQNSWEKQQQFVSDASHELRTPLAVIQSKQIYYFSHHLRQ